ncbi:MAG: extracellular solute-binding protein [Spirochaetaceae bacterium]|jgi:putative aldouronate transport system substrate-binding protein|nr:extracellular solute-binding protein [Spirochaetaceae bacterium]
MKKTYLLGCVLAMALVSPAFGGGGRQSSGGAVHPMRFVVPGTPAPDYETGIKAVNDKLKADGLDIEVSLIYIPWDVYDQRLNLMLSTGEPFELLHVMQDVKNISNLVGRDGIVPIDGYISKYANLNARFSADDWKAGRFNGKTYAVPATWRSFDNYLSAVTVLLNPLRKVAPEFPVNGNIDQFIDISKKMQEQILKDKGKTAYHWMHQVSWPANWLHRTYPTFPFYVEMGSGLILARQDGTIDSFFESQEFKWDSDNYRKLYTAGLIYPDILNTQSQHWTDEFGLLGVMLPSEANNTLSAWITLKQNLPAEEVTTYFLNPEKPHVTFYTQNLNAISATAEDPESGLKFLNWLYGSKENHDLFHYGIERVHYTASAPNKISPKLDSTGTQLYRADDWMTGYLPWMRFNELATEAQIAWATFKADNKVYTPIAGFIFDSTPVASQLAALQTEIIASFYPIRYGLVDYASSYPAAIARLKAAGLDQYMAEYRRQFAEYLKANPDVVRK